MIGELVFLDDVLEDRFFARALPIRERLQSIDHHSVVIRMSRHPHSRHLLRLLRRLLKKSGISKEEWPHFWVTVAFPSYDFKQNRS